MDHIQKLFLSIYLVYTVSHKLFPLNRSFKFRIYKIGIKFSLHLIVLKNIIVIILGFMSY